MIPHTFGVQVFTLDPYWGKGSCIMFDFLTASQFTELQVHWSLQVLNRRMPSQGPDSRSGLASQRTHGANSGGPTAPTTLKDFVQ